MSIVDRLSESARGSLRALGDKYVEAVDHTFHDYVRSSEEVVDQHFATTDEDYQEARKALMLDVLIQWVHNLLEMAALVAGALEIPRSSFDEAVSNAWEDAEESLEEEKRLRNQHPDRPEPEGLN